MSAAQRVEYGDWQTPDALALRAASLVFSKLDAPPATVIEPTCGHGAFLAAAQLYVPTTDLVGYDVNPLYVEMARRRLASPRARIEAADFFALHWERELGSMRGPILILGNPPWVTSADLGAMASKNLPMKSNWKALRGLDARTGKSNFDVCEWMITRLITALIGADATLAMLCKSSVARRVVELSARQGWPLRPGGLWRIDAGRHFDASVDAVLFLCHISREPRETHEPREPREPRRSPHSWPIYSSLESTEPDASFSLADGALVADPAAYAQTADLAGRSDPEWRSGLKHDCARVMELSRSGLEWINGKGDVVDIEPEHRYPLLKSSDIANGRARSDRAVIVTQRTLGDDTTQLRERAPKLWAYLSRYSDALESRKSSIYCGRPPFSIFGVGEYTFAPWKVAISGLYKRLQFSVIGPHHGQPVVLDDTCYFLPFSTEIEAQRALAALGSDRARDFFRGRVFWDAKRPINKAILQSLDIRKLIRSLSVAQARPRADMINSLSPSGIRAGSALSR